VPWVLLLPKTLHDTDPAIFISEVDDKYVVSLSELNGVYFTSSYDEERTSDELKELVKTLSVYNRKAPIKRIFTLNSRIDMEEHYKVLPVLANGDNQLAEGFEVHELYLKVLEHHPDVLNSQVNLLNLLPLPEPADKTKVLVPAAAAMFIISLFVGGYFLIFQGESMEQDNVAGVESEVEETVVESTPSQGSGSDEENTETSTQSSDIVKKDLVIRVENASGINRAASRTQDLLEDIGYTIDSIDTADNMRETTEVLIKDSMEPYRENLVKDLADDFPNLITDVLDDSEADYDVLILLGKNTEI